MDLDARNLSLSFANNKGADQFVHARSLINSFALHLLESNISKLATNRLLIFLPVSVAEETGLTMALLTFPKTPLILQRSIR